MDKPYLLLSRGKTSAHKAVAFKEEPTSESDSDSATHSPNSKPNKVYKFNESYRNSAYWKLPEQCREAIDKAQEKYQKSGKT